MARLAVLESFDLAPAPVTDGPGEEWLAGHRAGLAEGRVAALAEQAALRAETAEALAELGLTFREAQNHVLARLAPLFRALGERIVPEILRATLGQVLIEELQAAAETDARAPACLRVAPADLVAVTGTLAVLGGAPEIRADPRLGPGQVLIDRGGADTSFDFNRLSADIAAALAALGDEPERRLRHG